MTNDTPVQRPQRLLDQIGQALATASQQVAVLRELLDTQGPYGNDVLFDIGRDTVRSTAAATNKSVEEVFDALDHARRIRPNWIPRGIVFEALSRKDGSVGVDEFEDIVVRIAGYSGLGAVSPFF